MEEIMIKEKKLWDNRPHPFLGKHHTKASKLKMSEALKNGYATKRIIHPMKGKHHSKEAKEKMRLKKLGVYDGKNNPFYGRHHTEETKNKRRKENHPLWKGDDVSYKVLHKWIRKNKPKPDVCEMCNCFKPKEISNISGEYKRDIDDYQWLCVLCHSYYDNQIREAIGTMSR